ncbi:MAG: CoA-binding protein, partial [Chloroflexi bacterium]|nr:CoA-binding protein [Chloroflexota bacterium]
MDDAIVERFRAIFYPRSIAVVGASRDVTKYSHGWLKALSSNRYRGHIYAVNPRETQIGDFPVYSSVRDIPGEVDFVIVCVPRGAALAVIEDCAAKGVKAAHFFTGGFRETGKAEDMALEEQLVAKAQQAGVRVIGPNCMGIYNPEAGIPWGPS